jgi:cytochrome c-type biogenesis protein CcmH
MISFSILAALMLLLAIFLLLRPLMRAPQDRKVERKQVNLDIYKQRMAELDTDLAEGQIEQQEYQDAQQDLEKQLIFDIPEQEQQKTDSRRSQVSLISIIIAIPALAIGLYLYLGSPQTIDMPTAARQAASAHEGAQPTDKPVPSVAEMIANLEQRLQQQPDDAKGLYLLSRAYMHTQQFDKAEKSLEKLTQLAANDPNIWANYADVAAVNQQGKLDGRPYEYTKRALALDAKHPKALWLAGTYHFQQQQYDKAIRFWEILKQQLPADSKDAEMLRGSISDAQKRLGIEPTEQAQQPQQAQKEQQQAKTDSASAASISGRVALADALQDKVSPEDTVFVYARAVSGPRMPLAIVRKQVKDLPFEFTLDDSMAMMPQMKLSNFDKVVVSARVSKTGNAMTQSGDLISNQPEVDVKVKGALSLQIQNQVP